MATRQHNKPTMTRRNASEALVNNTDRVKYIIVMAGLVLNALKLLIQLIK